jgi:hypothetical protein
LSKYVGDTDKSLAAAFARAEGEGALLLLDEAGRPVEHTAEAIERRAVRRRFFASLDDATRIALMRWGGGTWDFHRLLATSPEGRDLATADDGRRLAWVCAQADMLLAAPWKKARVKAVVKRLLLRKRRGHAFHRGRRPRPPDRRRVLEPGRRPPRRIA